jgi:hypothetical protein
MHAARTRRASSTRECFVSEAIESLMPADAYFGRAETILAERRRITFATIANRRLKHRPQAAQAPTLMSQSLLLEMPDQSQMT